MKKLKKNKSVPDPKLKCRMKFCVLTFSKLNQYGGFSYGDSSKKSGG